MLFNEFFAGIKKIIVTVVLERYLMILSCSGVNGFYVVLPGALVQSEVDITLDIVS